MTRQPMNPADGLQPKLPPQTSPQPATPQQRGSFQRQPETARKVRNGVKLQGKPPFTARSPLAKSWLHLIESAIPSETMARGYDYARLGQTVRLARTPGMIEAAIQGTAPKAYITRIHVPVIADDRWDAVIQAMAGEAVYVAKLLASEIPAGIEELFARCEAPILPATSDGLRFECDCLPGPPCKHIAAVGYLVAELLDLEPLSIFAMLGLPADRALDRIRHARAANAAIAHADDPSQSSSTRANGKASSNRASDPMIPESQVEPLPLEQCLDEFWRAGPRLAELEAKPPPAHVPHALLRRLGPSPMQGGKFPMVGLLASIYDTVAAAAKKMRDEKDAGNGA